MAVLLIGLGNPGKAYRETRHNAGFLAIEKIAFLGSVKLKKPLLKNYRIGMGRIKGEDFILVQPLTFMNRSGMVIPSLFKKYHKVISRTVIIVDNLDLPEGTCRIKKRGSYSGHNGLKSILAYIESEDFIRLFIGIGRPAEKDQVISYVLSRPDDESYSKFMTGVERAAEAALKLVYMPIDEVLNVYNRR